MIKTILGTKLIGIDKNIINFNSNPVDIHVKICSAFVLSQNCLLKYNFETLIIQL